MQSHSSLALSRSLSMLSPSRTSGLMRMEREILFSSSSCSLVLFLSSWAALRLDWNHRSSVWRPSDSVRVDETHRSIPLGDGEVGPLGLALFLERLHHGLPLLLGLLETLPLLLDVPLLLLLDLPDPALLLLLLPLGHLLLLLGPGDLALGLLLLQLLQLVLLLGPLLPPFGDVLAQLLVEVRAFLVLAFDELGIAGRLSSRWDRAVREGSTRGRGGLSILACQCTEK